MITSCDDTKKEIVRVDKKEWMLVKSEFCAIVLTSNGELPYFNGSGDDGVSGSDDGDHGGSGDNGVDDDTQLKSMN